MKHIYNLLAVAILSISLTACHNELGLEQSKILIGDENSSSIDVFTYTTRMLILKGGTGKYKSNVNNSKLATVNINEDTLRITGILEGKTYASIWSGDECRKLNINIIVPNITSTKDIIRLFPRDENRSISINGGGSLAKMEVEDPMNILKKVKWNAKTNIIEIDTYCEGDAYLHIVGENNQTKTIKVEVRCKGETNGLGAYSTTSRILSELYRNTLVVHRKGVGTWICNEANPTTSKKTIKITPAITNPQKGSFIEAKLSLSYPDEFSSIKEGKYKLYIQDVKERYVVLVGRGFKLIIPYEKR